MRRMCYAATLLLLGLGLAGAERAAAAAPLTLKGGVQVQVGKPNANGLREIRETITLRASFAPPNAALHPALQDLRLALEIDDPANPLQTDQPQWLLLLPAGCFVPAGNGYAVPDLAAARQCGLFAGVVREQVVKPGEAPRFEVLEELTPTLTAFHARLIREGDGAWELLLLAAARELTEDHEPQWLPALGAGVEAVLTVGTERFHGLLRETVAAAAGPELRMVGRGQAGVSRPDANGLREIRERVSLDFLLTAGPAAFAPAKEALRIELALGGIREGEQPQWILSFPAGSLQKQGNGYAVKSLGEALQSGLQVVVVDGHTPLEELTSSLTGLRLLLLPTGNGGWLLKLDLDARELAETVQPQWLPKLGVAFEVRLLLGEESWSAGIREVGFQHRPR